jgi:epi-isozizaene synthase
MTSLSTHPVTLAQLAYPFLALSHPAPDVFDEATLAWVRRFRLAPSDRLDRVERIICGTAARYGFYSASPELVQLAADTIVWLFLFDDAYPEGRFRFDEHGLRSATERYAHFLEAHPRLEPFSEFSAALSDLFTRMKRLAPAHWCKRFIESFRYYAWGCGREAHFRQTGTVPTFAQYLELRRASFGFAPMADLFECVFGAVLTDEQRRSADVELLRQMGVDISACVNDLYSYEKERAAGDVCNMVRVLELSEGVSGEEACRRIGAFHNERLAQLLLLESQLGAKSAAPGVRALARAIREWSQGHHDWSIRCRRYDTRLAQEEQIGVTALATPRAPQLRTA